MFINGCKQLPVNFPYQKVVQDISQYVLSYLLNTCLSWNIAVLVSPIAHFSGVCAV